MNFQIQIGMENCENTYRSQLWKRGTLYIISHFFQILPAQPSMRCPMKGQLTGHFNGGSCRINHRKLSGGVWYNCKSLFPVVLPKCKQFSEDLAGYWRMISINSSPWGLWLHCMHSVLVDWVRWWERNQRLVFEAKRRCFSGDQNSNIE